VKDYIHVNGTKQYITDVENSNKVVFQSIVECYKILQNQNCHNNKNTKKHPAFQVTVVKVQFRAKWNKRIQQQSRI
jgi:uncharacterized protein (DUF736 family)